MEGNRHTSPWSLDASNQNASNRASELGKPHLNVLECLKHHDQDSTECCMDETEMGDEQSGSDLDDTDSTCHPGT